MLEYKVQTGNLANHGDHDESWRIMESWRNHATPCTRVNKVYSRSCLLWETFGEPSLTCSDLCSCSVLAVIFPGGPGLAGTRMSPFCILLQLRVMEVVSGDNWTCKTCRALIIRSPPTNQHPAFYRLDALSVAPTMSKH